MFLFKVNSLSFWKSIYEEIWDSEKVFFCFKGELLKKLLEIFAPKVFCSFKFFLCPYVRACGAKICDKNNAITKFIKKSFLSQKVMQFFAIT